MGADVFHQSRRRLTFYFSAIMAVLSLFLIVLLYRCMLWAVSSEQEDELISTAADIAYSQSYLIQHPTLFFDEEFNAAKGNRDRLFFYVYDTEGRLLNFSRASWQVEILAMEAIRTWDEAPGEVKSFNSTDNKYKMHLMMTAQPMVIDNEVVGMVFVGRELTAVYQGLRKAMFILGGLAVMAFILATIIGHFMAGKAIEPLLAAYEKQRQFAADASHELRTPLSILMASAEILEKDKSVTSPFLKQVIEDVHDEVRKMTKLVSDLLVVARSDNEALKLKPQEMDLVAAAEQTLRMMQPLAEKKQIELTREGADEIVTQVDEAKFKQLMLILVDNALKYTPEGGKVNLSLTQKAGKIRLAVSDTGIGIAREDLDRVFDRFYRVDKARSREMGGNGLGLAIARELAHLFGGEIKVASELGKGTTFTVEWKAG